MRRLLFPLFLLLSGCRGSLPAVEPFIEPVLKSFVQDWNPDPVSAVYIPYDPSHPSDWKADAGLWKNALGPMTGLRVHIRASYDYHFSGLGSVANMVYCADSPKRKGPVDVFVICRYVDSQWKILLMQIPKANYPATPTQPPRSEERNAPKRVPPMPTSKYQ